MDKVALIVDFMRTIFSSLLFGKCRRNIWFLLIALLFCTTTIVQPLYGSVSTTREVAEEVPPRCRFLSLTVHPILVWIRPGINIEYMPFSHHGFMITPSCGYAINAKDFINVKHEGEAKFGCEWGLEIGYRWYSGDNGPRGFFIGPIVGLQKCYFTGEVKKKKLFFVRQEEVHDFKFNVSEKYIGLDLGGQWVFANGFTLGFGLGGMFISPELTRTGYYKDIQSVIDALNEHKDKNTTESDKNKTAETLKNIFSGKEFTRVRVLISLGYTAVFRSVCS